jgi:hypothetical protein
MGLFGTACKCEGRVEQLEAALRALQLEQAELHDKCYRWMQRTNKRVRDEARESPAVPMTANERILARRMRRYQRNGTQAPGREARSFQDAEEIS